METKRLILRYAENFDIEDILDFRNSEFVLTYNAMDQADEQMILDSLASTIVMEEKETRKVIGCIFVSEDSLRYETNSRCISYYLSENYALQGFMSEALEALITLLFNQGVELVSARVFKENMASIRLLEKLGFRHEGTLRKAVKGYKNIIYDDCVFSILKDEWIKKVK